MIQSSAEHSGPYILSAMNAASVSIVSIAVRNGGSVSTIWIVFALSFQPFSRIAQTGLAA
jgi:hypothetical protein